MRIPVLFEDENYLVINKPAGLVVHGDGKTEEQSVADWVLENYPEAKEVGEPLLLSGGQKISRPGIVHRLDRETSGVLAIAKNRKAYEFLKKQFQNREVEKIYFAIVHGEIKGGEGVIDRAIGRSRSDFRKWTAERGSRGEMREARTEYKVLAEKNGFSLVEVFPRTGRTHQIRVHFKAINHPLLGDSLYAPQKSETLGLGRLALHAKSIRFENLNGKKIEVEAPLPADFKKAAGFFG